MSETIYQYRLTLVHESDSLDVAPMEALEDSYLLSIDFGGLFIGPQGPAGPGAEIATTETAGIVKPDGSTITVDEDGTLHAVGGGGTGNHTQLTNRDAANQHPISSITGLQDALGDKQGTIEDLESIREGAALGSTAIQQHQSLAAYRMASEQDVIDNAVKGRVSAIEAKEGGWDAKADLEDIPDVVDNVTSTATAKALSANQGKLLNDRINNIANRGRFLSLWNAATGMPLTNPSGYSYEYRTGDFFIVSSVGDVNYIPNGDTYDGEPSTTVYSGALKTNDTIFYDGSVWSVFDTPAGAGDLLDVYVNGSSVVVDGVAYVLVPTTLAELAGDSTHRVVTDVQVAAWNAKYTKPSGGIPASDLAEGVIVQEVFIVEHRVTTYAEIIAAAAAGKIIICNKDNTTYYGRNIASGQDIYLTTVPNTVGGVGYLKVTSADIWGSGTLTVENTANKVSAITAQSTNAQYAGAKAVYDFVLEQVGDIESLLAAL